MPEGKDQEYQEQFEAEETQDSNIIDDLMPEQEAPQDNDPEEELEDSGEDEVEETEESVSEETAPEPKKYKVKGKEYTLEELVAQGLLENIVTQSEQASHYQELYHGVKTQLDQGAQAQAAQGQAQAAQVAAQPQLDPRQIRAAMIPQMQAAVQQGFFEQDFVEDYPQAVATQMYIYNDYMQMKQLVTGMYQYFMRENQEKLYNTVKNNFNSACETLASKHSIYTGLKTPEDRDKFFEYLSTKVNPEAGSINEEFLGKQYLAYQQDNILQTINQSSQQRNSKKKKQRKLAAGEGSPAPRKDAQHQRKPSDDEAIIAGIMEQFDLS